MTTLIIKTPLLITPCCLPPLLRCTVRALFEIIIVVDDITRNNNSVWCMWQNFNLFECSRFVKEVLNSFSYSQNNKCKQQSLSLLHMHWKCSVKCNQQFTILLLCIHNHTTATDIHITVSITFVWKDYFQNKPRPNACTGPVLYIVFM